MSGDLAYGYLLEFRLAGYGWHQRSEFNASFSTYRFFSGMQVLHALTRFELLINRPGAPYRPGERQLVLEQHALAELGIPDGRRWASPAVPVTEEALAVDRQVYNSRQEPVVGLPRQAVFPTWGTLEMMRPFPPEQDGGSPYCFQALYLAEKEHQIGVGDVYWIGKKRAMLQVTRLEAHRLAAVDDGPWDTGVFLEIPLRDLEIFESYRPYDATARGVVIARGRFVAPAVRCGEALVPMRLLAPDRSGESGQAPHLRL